MRRRLLGNRRKEAVDQVNDSDFILSSLTYSGDSFSVAGETSSSWGFYIKSDGTKLWVIGRTEKTIFEYVFGTPFVLSTLALNSSFFVASVNASSFGFGENGTDLVYQNDNPYDFYRRALATPWDITSTGSGINSFTHSNSSMRGIHLKKDGTKIYGVNRLNNSVYTYSLSTPFLPSTATLTATNLLAEISAPMGIWFSTDGVRMLISKNTGVIYSYTLSTPFEVSSKVYDNDTLNVSGEITTLWESAYVGGKLFVIGSGNAMIKSYI